MGMRRWWRAPLWVPRLTGRLRLPVLAGPFVALAVLLAFILIPASRRTLHAEVAKRPGTPDVLDPMALVRAHRAAPVEGIDLSRVGFDDVGALTSLPDGRVARLHVDPTLQRTAKTLMAIHHVPEAAVVMIDVPTGHVLAYASHVEKGAVRDLCVEATSPAASVFKIVTGAALVELASVNPDAKECYSGGEQRITPQDLEPNPARDRWCTTLGGAMGRSINTVFARLALRSLKPAQLEDVAKGFGFGSSVAFDVPVQASAVKMPEDGLAFARTAAGFWNTTLSPLHAAMLSATVARGGEVIRPQIVRQVEEATGDVAWTSPGVQVLRRAIKPETAALVTSMMERTVTEGTSYRAFHDARRTPFLPGVAVAGKTGTLTDAEKGRFYTWFTGFAPTHPEAGQRQVAIAVLVVNQATWTVKANTVARDMLRSFFAGQKVPGVSSPSMKVSARPQRPGASSQASPPTPPSP